ncbi:FAD dependent oxidoreductase [Salinisphaera dokdonensis CL-ES53]|uniref:FAD dependent oxidoreductase n=1 Tax=Salinisphaera dokdonensis CL-ES53 TaxID=1304272 RepID=A0ABV2B0I5_9GAMM
MPNALIIGAGVAGASAAATLAAEDWNVTVVDKATRPGGRCATRRVAADPASAWFDYGAQYFTARAPDFRSEIERDLEAGALTRWQPSIHIARRFADGWQRTPSPDDRERLMGPDGLNGWVRHRLEKATVDVQCGRQVIAVTHEKNGWTLQFEGGHEPLIADALIVTLPAVQAAALLGHMTTDIPVLASADQALDPCQSLVVSAPPLDDCHSIFVKDGHLAWCADNSHKAGAADTQRDLWTLHAGPAFSSDHLEHAPEDITAALTEEFAALSGIEPSHIEPVRHHRWLYARPGPNPPPADTLCISRPGQRLALAGDWLAGGRVEGAWLSGRAAARSLL